MKLIFIMAALLTYCSCDKKIYPEDNAWHCWSCELKENGITNKFDTCLNGSLPGNVFLDSSGKILDGFCYVK